MLGVLATLDAILVDGRDNVPRELVTRGHLGYVVTGAAGPLSPDSLEELRRGRAVSVAA